MTVTPAQVSSQNVDVVIVGGGLVGGLCALLLADSEVNAIVIDDAPILSDEVCAIASLQKRDARVWALSPASLSLLERVGVWSRVARHAPYQGMQVWSRDGRGTLDFGQLDQRNVGLDDTLLGSMVEPTVLSMALQQTMRQRFGSGYLQSKRLQHMERFSQYWQVTLESGECYNTPLVIGADGAGSMVRRLAGIQVEQLDYQQMALTCAICTEKPHDGIARQVFLPTGPLAFLPLANHPHQTDTEQDCWQSIVWTLPAVDAQDMSDLDDAVLMEALTQASASVLGKVVAIESRGIFPLKAQQAKLYCLDGLALIGDAAHVIHPMAGQGVNLGCLDAAVLADALLHDRVRGLWAHRQTLKRYERERKLPNSIMMHGLSLLGWLQRSDQQWMMWLRGEGMQMLTKFDTLRLLISEEASGRSVIKSTRYHVTH
jgi:2-polyprenylphenol 6-hydroxylase